MKILAVYGSNDGQAQAILRRVTAVLEGRGHTVSVFKGNAIPADLAVEGFDASLLRSPWGTTKPTSAAGVVDAWRVVPTWCLQAILLCLFAWASYAGRQASRAPQVLPCGGRGWLATS
jgi:hypothetical protein